MSSHVTRALATTDALDTLFADRSALQAMLDVEVALARVEARLGVIPAAAAVAIERAADATRFDAARLAREARAVGTLVVPLVTALTESVRASDEPASRYVHWGATSQDIADTALVLLMNRAIALVADDLRQLTASLRALSDRHAGTMMLGRTLLQPAPPVTFGLKVAGWYAGVARSWARLERARRDAAHLQFGGASGTLAALGDRGLDVADGLAAELGLAGADVSWHAYRDRLAAVLAACAIYTGVLGKLARDISLLMQAEVAEAAEAGGGSSTMPHKRNPVGCAIALAASTRVPGLVASYLAGLPQEHERALGAWHAEWPTVTDVLQATGSAASAMRQTVDGLTVDGSKMRANLDATGGVILSERVVMMAGAALGRDRAHALVRDIVARCRATGESFGRALRQSPELMAVLSDADLLAAESPDTYLGAAEAERQRLLATPDGDS